MRNNPAPSSNESTGTPDAAIADRVADLLVSAESHAAAGQLDQALGLFMDAMHLDKNNPTIFRKMGVACFQNQRHKPAIKCFTRLTELLPRDSGVWTDLGAIQNHAGCFDDAVKSLQTALKFDRGSAAAYYQLGVACNRLNRSNLARQALRQAIRLMPEFGLAWYELGQTYLAAGSLRQAAEHFTKASEADPDLDAAKQALETTRELLVQKKEEQRFGRLVDTSQKQAVDSSPSEATVASERILAVRNCLVPLVPASQELASQIETLTALVREIRRQVTGSRDQIVLVDLQDNFHQAVRRLSRARRDLKQRVASLSKLRPQAHG